MTDSIHDFIGVVKGFIPVIPEPLLSKVTGQVDGDMYGVAKADVVFKGSSVLSAHMRDALDVGNAVTYAKSFHLELYLGGISSPVLSVYCTCARRTWDGASFFTTGDNGGGGGGGPGYGNFRRAVLLALGFSSDYLDLVQPGDTTGYKYPLASGMNLVTGQATYDDGTVVATSRQELAFLLGPESVYLDSSAFALFNEDGALNGAPFVVGDIPAGQFGFVVNVNGARSWTNGYINAKFRPSSESGNFGFAQMHNFGDSMSQEAGKFAALRELTLGSASDPDVQVIAESEDGGPEVTPLAPIVHYF